MRNTATIAGLMIALLALIGCRTEPVLHLGITTTLDDSGLLSLLSDRFYEEHHIIIKPVVAGSGQLFRLITHGDVDIAITHEPNGEKKLLQQGIITKRLPLFHNHFVIVGDQKDPAKIREASTTRDAFTRLAKSTGVYLSRNDHSGTHRMEQHWWRHDIPNTLTVFHTGAGMGETLTIAAEKQAYTLVDIGTWLRFAHKQTLTLLWQDPPTLKNPYHLLILPNSQKKSPQQTLADTFSQWIQDPSTQLLIKHYRIHSQPIFMYE